MCFVAREKKKNYENTGFRERFFNGGRGWHRFESPDNESLKLDSLGRTRREDRNILEKINGLLGLLHFAHEALKTVKHAFH